MKKVVFCIHSLQAGGMERVCSQLIKYTVQKSPYEVHLVLYGKDPEFFFEVPDEVIIDVVPFRFNEKYRLFSTLKRILWLRRKVRSIAAAQVVSFGEYWNSMVLLSLLGTSIPVYVSDRSQPDKSLGRLQDKLRNWLYPGANTVIAQTEKAKAIYEQMYKAKNWAVMGNPIRPISCEIEPRQKQILMVGRFIQSKHQDQLIRIFGKLNAPDWELVLVGDDHLKQENRSQWEQLALDLGIRDKVLFEGKQSKVDAYYCRASVFAFTSSSEGFPNVIGEAQAAGLPVVAYDCVAGPSELITDDENGFLVPLYDEKLFSQRLQQLIDSEELRRLLGEKAKKSIQTYSAERIGQKFLEIIS